MSKEKNYKVIRPLVKALYATGDYTFPAIHNLCVSRYGSSTPSVGTMRNWYAAEKSEWNQAREIGVNTAQAAYKRHNEQFAVVSAKTRPDPKDYDLLNKMLDHAEKLEEKERRDKKFILELLYTDVDESAIFLKFINWLYEILKEISPETYEMMSKDSVLKAIKAHYKEYALNAPKA